MGIARQSIEDLKKRSKISDFILATTSGKLRGTKGMALCPFHGEKTASMSFTDIENLFHCFGCKMGGDIYKYVQEIHNLEFQDAIELVAEKYGFKLSYTETSQMNDFKNFQQKINLIDEYFKEVMDSEKSKKAKDKNIIERLKVISSNYLFRQTFMSNFTLKLAILLKKA